MRKAMNLLAWRSCRRLRRRTGTEGTAPDRLAWSVVAFNVPCGGTASSFLHQLILRVRDAAAAAFIRLSHSLCLFFF
jgi:hypothetical protein